MSAAMLYSAVIGALLGVVALVSERIVAQFGWPRRGVWLLSLTASVVLPVSALLTYDPPRIALPGPDARQRIG